MVGVGGWRGGGRGRQQQRCVVHRMLGAAGEGTRSPSVGGWVLCRSKSWVGGGGQTRQPRCHCAAPRPHPFPLPSGSATPIMQSSPILPHLPRAPPPTPTPHSPLTPRPPIWPALQSPRTSPRAHQRQWRAALRRSLQRQPRQCPASPPLLPTRRRGTSSEEQGPDAPPHVQRRIMHPCGCAPACGRCGPSQPFRLCATLLPLPHLSFIVSVVTVRNACWRAAGCNCRMRRGQQQAGTAVPFAPAAP